MAWLVPRPGNRQTRDRHRLAPQGVQAFLDVEVAAGKAKPTTGVEGDPCSGPADVTGEYILDRIRYRSHDGRIAKPRVAEGGDMSAIWRGRIVLGCTVACLAATASWTLPASAGCISQTFGSNTMHNFDGKFGWSQRFGNIVVHSGALFTDR